MKPATYRAELRALLGDVRRVRGADQGPHRGGLTAEEREFWRRLEAVLRTATEQASAAERAAAGEKPVTLADLHHASIGARRGTGTN